MREGLRRSSRLPSTAKRQVWRIIPRSGHADLQSHSTPVTALSSGDSSDSNSIFDEEDEEPSVSPQPPSTLVQESDLEVVDGYHGLLVVNKRFSLLICTECGSGMKPESVFKHFTEPHPVIVTSSNGIPDKLESRTVNHHMKLESERKHLEQLKKWLLAKGIKAASGDNRDK